MLPNFFQLVKYVNLKIRDAEWIQGDQKLGITYSYY